MVLGLLRSNNNPKSNQTAATLPTASADKVEKIVEEFNNKRLQNGQFGCVGPKDGITPGTPPAIHQELRKVTSWLDVPALLVELKQEDDKAIRISFPDAVGDKIVRFPTSHLPEDPNDPSVRQAALTAHEETEEKVMWSEQAAINDFLCEFHGKPLAQIKDALIKQLEDSASFRVYRIDNDYITAKQWVDEFFKTHSKKETKQLSVTKIISIKDNTQAATELSSQDILASLSDSVSKNIPVVFEAQNNGSPQDLKTLAEALSSKAYPCLIPTGVDQARVWLIPAGSGHTVGTSYSWNSKPHLPAELIEVKRLDAFVRENMATGNPGGQPTIKPGSLPHPQPIAAQEEAQRKAHQEELEEQMKQLYASAQRRELKDLQINGKKSKSGWF